MTKVELEFTTDISDKSEILTKISQIVKAANELGFNLEEAELESAKIKYKDKEKKKYKDKEKDESEVEQITF
jgi:hypothetical protein